MNRRNRTLIVVGLAVLLASIASFGVYRAISRIPVREVPIATRHQVVAKVPIPVGTRLTADQVQLVAWPADSPVAGGFTNVNDVVGRGVISSLVQNEPLSETKLAPRESGAGLPPSIPPGMRAMSVKVNDVVGVAGFAVPGTHVDVLVTLRPDKDSISRIVISDVQVLASGTMIDQEKSKDGKPIPTSVVTLLLSPQDSERLALAENEGSIMLALRNPVDAVNVSTSGARTASLLAAEVKPVKEVVHGQPRMVVPPAPPAPKPYVVDAIRGGKRNEETIK